MALLSNCIGYGLAADRPAAGAPGAVYIDSDDNNVYRDNGTTWDLVTTPWTPALVAFGVESALPAAGTAGRIYFTSDTEKVFRDNGATWDQVVNPPPPPFALIVVPMSAPLTLTQGNVFVPCTNAAQAAGDHLTLPLAASFPGQVIHTMCPNGNQPNLLTQGSDTIVGVTFTNQVVSDGVDKWYGIDG